MSGKRTGEDNGLDAVVLAQLPDEQFCEVPRVDELPQRLAGARDDEGCAILYMNRALSALYIDRNSGHTFRKIAFVNQRGNDVCALKIAARAWLSSATAQQEGNAH